MSTGEVGSNCELGLPASPGVSPVVGLAYWDSRGCMWYAEHDAGNGFWFFEGAVQRVSEDGQSWMEPNGQYVKLPVKEMLDREPTYYIPPYEKHQIERAQKQLKELVGAVAAKREELHELKKGQEGLEARVRKFGGLREQMELVMAHMEGKDLWVLQWSEYGQVKLGQLSEFKSKDYGFRMLGLYGGVNGESWTQHYDWKIHQYGDDSGNAMYAAAGVTREECLARVKESLERMVKTGWSWDCQVLKGMQDLGVELPGKFQKEVEKAEKRRTRQQLEQKEKEKARVIKAAKDAGLEVFEGGHRV